MTCRRCGDPVAAVGAFVPPYCEACSAIVLAEEDEVARSAARGLAVRQAGGAGRLLDWSLATYPKDAEGAHALVVANQWLDLYRGGGRANLWLSGPGGTGKTGLAWSIARALNEGAVDAHFALPATDRPSLMMLGLPALFVVWPDLLNELKAQFQRERSGEGGASVLLDRAGRVPVLVLDELGGERPTPYALEQLSALVDRRYLAQRPLVVTSNYGTRELAARLGHEEEIVGKRIVSRLVDGAVGFKFEGPTRRRAHAGVGDGT